jgi:2,4-dienoyl-CoA reductase-like NADH-dependent reductase (Old Yellow Enzyme family)
MSSKNLWCNSERVLCGRDYVHFDQTSNNMDILTPIKVSSLTLKNRLIMPAMGTGFASRDGAITDRLINYYKARAMGGVGLIIIEETAVEPLGLGYGNQLRIYEESNLDGFETLAETVHNGGGKVLVQLAHAGRQTLHAVIKDQSIAPSPIPCLKFGEMPRELSIQEIQEIERAFIRGAEKAKDCGYDGVEVHAAHGYLLCEFLSPLSNIREDQYGGSVTNRTRILVKIIQGIRESVGSDFPIFVKISGDEYCEGGISIKDSLKIGKILEESGAWAITVSAGNYGAFDWVVQPAEKEPGCLIHLAEAFKRKVDIPIIAVGRINDPFLAEEILIDKKADLIAMGRALIADPYLPRKVEDGRISEIDKCMATNACIKTLFRRGREIVCTVNENLGTEKELAYQ